MQNSFPSVEAGNSTVPSLYNKKKKVWVASERQFVRSSLTELQIPLDSFCILKKKKKRKLEVNIPLKLATRINLPNNQLTRSSNSILSVFALIAFITKKIVEFKN